MSKRFDDKKITANLVRSYKCMLALTDLRNFRYVISVNKTAIEQYFNLLNHYLRKDEANCNMNHMARLTEFYIRRDPDLCINYILHYNLLYRFIQNIEFPIVQNLVLTIFDCSDNGHGIGAENFKKVLKYSKLTTFFNDLVFVILNGEKELDPKKFEVSYKPVGIESIVHIKEDNVEGEQHENYDNQTLHYEIPPPKSEALLEEVNGFRIDIDGLKIIFKNRSSQPQSPIISRAASPLNKISKKLMTMYPSFVEKHEIDKIEEIQNITSSDDIKKDNKKQVQITKNIPINPITIPSILVEKSINASLTDIAVKQSDTILDNKLNEISKLNLAINSKLKPLQNKIGQVETLEKSSSSTLGGKKGPLKPTIKINKTTTNTSNVKKQIALETSTSNSVKTVAKSPTKSTFNSKDMNNAKEEDKSNLEKYPLNSSVKKDKKVQEKQKIEAKDSDTNKLTILNSMKEIKIKPIDAQKIIETNKESSDMNKKPLLDINKSSTNSKISTQNELNVKLNRRDQKTPVIAGYSQSLSLAFFDEEFITKESTQQINLLYPISTKALIETEIDKEAKKPEYAPFYIKDNDSLSYACCEVLDILLQKSLKNPQQAKFRKLLDLPNVDYSLFWSAIFDVQPSRFFERLIKV